MLEESLLSSRSMIDALKSDSEAETASFKDRDETRLAEIQTVKTKNTKLQAELSQTKKDAVGLRANLVDAAANSARLEGEIATKSHELKNFEHALRVKLDIIAEIETKLARGEEESCRRDREAEEKQRALTTDMAALVEEKDSAESEMRAQFTMAEQKISTLTKEIAEIRKRHDEESTAKQAQVDGLGLLIEEARNHNSDVSGKLDAMTILRDSAQAQLTAKSEEVVSLSLQIEFLESKMEKTEVENVKTCADFAEKVEQKGKENADLQAALDAWKSRFGESADELDKAVGETEIKLAKSIARENDLSKSVEELRAKIQTIESDLVTRDTILDEWRCRVGDDPATGELKISRLTGRLQEADEEMKKGADRLRKEEEKVVRLETKMKEDKNRQEETIYQAEAKIGGVKTQLDEKVLELSTAISDLTTTRSKVESLNNTLMDYTRKCVDSETRVLHLMGDLEERDAKIVEMQGTIDELRQAKAAMEKAYDEEVSSMTKSMEETSASHKEAENAVQIQLEEKQAELEKITITLTEVEEALRHKSNESEETKGSMTDLQERLKESFTQLELSEAEKEGALLDLGKLQLRFDEVENDLAKAKEEVERAESSRQALIADLDVKANELNDFKLELSKIQRMSDDLNESLRKENELKESMEVRLKSTEERLQMELEGERQRSVDAAKAADAQLVEKVAEIEALHRKIADAEEKMMDAISRAVALEEKCQSLEDEGRKEVDQLTASLRAEVAVVEHALRNEKEIVERQKIKLEATEKDGEQLRAELEAAQSAALGFKTAEEELKERTNEEIADLKEEVERARQLGVANDVNASDVLKQAELRFIREKAKMEERFVKEQAESENKFFNEKAELEECLRRMEDDFAVEKELLEATNSRHVVNLEKDKKKLDKKLAEVTKATDETIQSKDAELSLLKVSFYVKRGIHGWAFSGSRRIFVPDGINSVGDYNSSRVGVVCLCLSVCVPTFFHVSRLDNF